MPSHPGGNGWLSGWLKNSSARDMFGLSNLLIKFVLEPILEPLVHITNSSGCFPDIIKCSMVILIHKKDPLCETSNYRPISLTPIISKINLISN